MSAEYVHFLRAKHRLPSRDGFDAVGLSSVLYPFQRAIVEWACRNGRAAVFAGCGLGKTLIQLEWASQVCQQTGGDVLILAPLAVAGQTRDEATRFGLPGVTVCRGQADVRRGTNITNYEMLDHFEPTHFRGVVLDESSILKAFQGKTKRRLVEAFAGTHYRLACTATPAPNDYMELQNHAAFLGMPGHDDMLGRFFVNDPMEAGKYRLKGHARRAFWRWVHGWAVSVSKPSDMGPFDDADFRLPALQIVNHVIQAADQPRGEWLFPGLNPAALSATNMHGELRLTAAARAQRVADVVATEPDAAWVVWCNTNYEADAVTRLIPDAVEVRGSQSSDEKERRLAAFASGKARVMVTKPSIAGYGLNWQHCHNVAFIGLSYSYEDYYQAIRRSWRFGQAYPVTAHIVQCESERAIADAVQEKETAHEALVTEMCAEMRRAQQEETLSYELTPTPPTRVLTGPGWELRLADSVTETATIEAETVGLTLFSPPFSNLYVYSDGEADMGNSADHAEFFEHYSYLARELLRVTISGRLCVMHVKDLPRFMNSHGAAGLYDFPGEMIRVMEAVGWQYHSRITIWKDPVLEMQRTKNHGLLYKNLRADSCVSRQGMADYVLAFRKFAALGEAPEPVGHTREGFPLEKWQRWASPVWDDICQTRVLDYRDAKAAADERHICPLQLDVIERCIELWSNPGDLVFSPFAGIGSEGYQALLMGRRFLGIELKESYWEQSRVNLETARQVMAQQQLFIPGGAR